MQKDIETHKLSIISTIPFYREENKNEYFAKIILNGHEEICNVSSSRFISYLDSQLRTITGKPVVGAWGDLIKMQKQNCELSNKTVKIYTRIANDSCKITYFLADDDWHYVEITKAGWNITGMSNFLFVKKNNAKEQLFPKQIQYDSDDRLRKYINLDDNSYILFKINLIQEFFFNSSHYVSIINSSYGSGKSTLTKIWRTIIDPANADVTILSNNIEDFKVQLANNSVITLDNTRRLTNEFSDLICSAVTGTSFSKRTLYTNADETILKLKNIFIVNGIDAIPRNPDLISRCLLFELSPISDKKRKSDAEIWESFGQDLPYILGMLFNTLATALGKLETLTNIPSGRMADATREMLAIALALNISEEKFYDILKDNHERLNSACSKQNDLVMAILDYMESKSKKYIVGKVSDIFNDIRNFKKGDLINFPKAPSAFSRKINENHALLLAAGITVTSIEKKDATYLTIKRNSKNKK